MIRDCAVRPIRRCSDWDLVFAQVDALEVAVVGLIAQGAMRAVAQPLVG